MSFKPIVLGLGVFAAALSVSTARAATCQTDGDCGKGFTCVLVPIATPEPACAPGEKCVVPDPVPAVATTGYCSEASCAIDGDCGDGMVCHSETTSACSGGTTPACPPNADCAKPVTTSTTCTETKTSTCRYKWELPCNTADDCGGGFDCAPSVIGMCSGSGGTGVATPGTATTAPNNAMAPAATSSPPSVDPTVPTTTPPASTCTTTTSFPGSCTPKATTCTTDADCPALWTCQDVYLRATPVAAGPTSNASSGAAGASGTATTSGATPPAASGAPAPAADPTPTPKACVSPFGGGFAISNGSGSDPQVPGTTTGSGAGGTSGNEGGGTTTTAGGTPPKTNGPSMGTTSADASTPSAGCAVGGGDAHLGVLLLGALGLFLARRRRHTI